jgi:hypothetical protein
MKAEPSQAADYLDKVVVGLTKSAAQSSGFMIFSAAIQEML